MATPLSTPHRPPNRSGARESHRVPRKKKHARRGRHRVESKSRVRSAEEGRDRDQEKKERETKKGKIRFIPLKDSDFRKLPWKDSALEN